MYGARKDSRSAAAFAKPALAWLRLFLATDPSPDGVAPALLARRGWAGLLVLAVAASSCFLQLGAAKLWDRDEPRNAGCAREMLERNDWIVPVFNGELRTHKPILLYWQTMLAYTAFGVSEFSARFSSALLGVGTCLLTWAIGRRLFSNTVGIIAGCALATSLMFVVASRAATPDATLIFYMTAALTVYVYGAFPQRDKAHSDAHDNGLRAFPYRVTWAAFYGLLSMAVLAKGPVGFLLPTAAVGMFLLIVTKDSNRISSDSRSWANIIWHAACRVAGWFAPRHFLVTTWRMHVLTAVAVLAVVALPWYVWVGWRTDGEWLRGFFLEHNFGRATQAMEGHRGSALWFYPAAMLVGFFPWSLFAVPVLLDLGRRVRTATLSPALCLLICWVVVIAGAFSLAKTKLPSYVTPTYPALALITAYFLDRWCRGRTDVSRRWMQLAYTCSVLVGVSIMVGLVLLGRRELPGEEVLAVIGFAPLLLGVLGWWCLQRCTRGLVLVHVSCAVLMVLLGFGWGAVRVSRHQSYDVLLDAFPDSSDTPVAALACLEPSWVFYSGRTIYEVDFPSAEEETLPPDVERALTAPLGQYGWFRPRPPVNQLFSRWPDARLLVTEDGLRKLGNWRSELEVVAETTRFLKHEKLYLMRLRRASAPQMAAAAR